MCYSKNVISCLYFWMNTLPMMFITIFQYSAITTNVITVWLKDGPKDPQLNAKKNKNIQDDQFVLR